MSIINNNWSNIQNDNLYIFVYMYIYRLYMYICKLIVHVCRFVVKWLNSGTDGCL